jgi:hypothetical protein
VFHRHNLRRDSGEAQVHNAVSRPCGRDKRSRDVRMRLAALRSMSTGILVDGTEACQ